MLSGCMQHDKYPEPKRENIVDEFFGTKIYDPYRWMENLNDPELKEWIKLMPLQTEGVSYSILGISTPYGGGFIITTGTFYKFGLYFNYMKNYTDYLDEIETRRQQGLNPNPIEDAALIKEIISHIEDEGSTQYKAFLEFFIYNTIP